MSYEIWEMQSGNLAGSYSTRASALQVIHSLLSRHGRDGVISLALIREGRDGSSTTIAEGEALAALALAEGPKTVIAS